MFTCPKRRTVRSFHVAMHDYAREFRLTLEGPFTAAEAPEVEARWRTAASIIGTRDFRIDLDGVTYADTEALGLLARMREAAAQFIAAAPEALRIVNEIKGTVLEGTASEEHRPVKRVLRDFAALLNCLALRFKNPDRLNLPPAQNAHR